MRFIRSFFVVVVAAVVVLVGGVGPVGAQDDTPPPTTPAPTAPPPTAPSPPPPAEVCDACSSSGSGGVNGSRGHSELRYVSCDGPGVIPFEDPGDVPCRAWFMTSSSGQVDANGVLDRISIYATIYWDVSYTSNAGGGDSDWFRHDVIAERHEVAVAEIQSVITD